MTVIDDRRSIGASRLGSPACRIKHFVTRITLCRKVDGPC